MEYLPSFRDELAFSHAMTEEEFKAKKFGLPKVKKFPMPDAAHVRSAIKFFNYVKPSQERELANAILARMEEYRISPDDINVGSDNRFRKYLMESYLEHHGILGQKWGVKNGPPYPLGGGDYTRTEIKAIKQARKSKYSRYNKRHYDQIIEKGTTLQTLARDPNRTKDVDMFYASYTKKDNDRYNALFNHKTPQTVYDEDGNPIGTAKMYKYKIQNKATSDIKVASQDSGAKAIMNLYEKDRDFYNFVRDPERLSKYLQKMYVPDGKKYRTVLSNLQKEGYKPTDRDLHTLYDMVNCVIPNTAHDVAVQRAKLFRELKKDGYGAVLDINDAINHPLASNSPVIVFDMEPLALQGVRQTSMAEVTKSKALTTGRYFLGLYDR